MSVLSEVEMLTDRALKAEARVRFLEEQIREGHRLSEMAYKTAVQHLEGAGADRREQLLVRLPLAGLRDHLAEALAPEPMVRASSATRVALRSLPGGKP